MKKDKIITNLARTVSFILITTVLLGFHMPMASAYRAWSTPASSLPFSDVQPNDWFHSDVAWAYTNNITTGTSSTEFSPGDNVTRAQFATFLYRIAGSPPVTAANPFHDVPRGTWFTNAVIWALETGVTTGTSPTTFRPDRPITREELATMLHRYIQNTRTTHLGAPVYTTNHFHDGDQVSVWALDAVRWAAHYGIIGRNGSLDARSNASRAEAVAMLNRAAHNFLTRGRTPAHRPPPTPAYVNPLTGIPSLINITQNRPVAVSLSNAGGAMPTNAKNGISQADIIYEMLFEYGETRFLALYQNFGAASTVGSIRSVRHYTVHLAEAHDAILVHAGGSPLGMDEVRDLYDMTFNEVHGPGRSIFRRDINRVPGHTVLRYHSAVTTGAAATSGFSRYRTRTTLRGDFNNTLSFTNTPIPTGGTRAHNVNVRFSWQKSSIFTYDERQNLYTMSQRGSVLRDVNNRAPVTFTNLIILRMPTEGLPDDTEGRLDINTVGSGTGYFASNGRMVPINWSRPDISSQFAFTLGNGRAFELGRGRTYIGIIPTEGANVSVSFR